MDSPNSGMYLLLCLRHSGVWFFHWIDESDDFGRLMVPPTSVCHLTHALQRRGFHGLHRWCRNTLNHKFYIPTPEFFREENIPFELVRITTLRVKVVNCVALNMLKSLMQVIQQQGEGIVVLPNTAHSGGNLGPNLAEACNFGSYKWIPYGCVAPNCPCMWVYGQSFWESRHFLEVPCGYVCSREDAVHADLSDIVAVHEPSLLKAYIENDIVNVVGDQYFQKSILVKKDFSCVSTSSQPIDHVDCSSERKRLQAKNSRIMCPVCEISWAYVQKGNMVTHLVKYHKSRIEEQIVTKFIEQYSLTIT